MLGEVLGYCVGRSSTYVGSRDGVTLGPDDGPLLGKGVGDPGR